ncbi:hypothetical protein [Glycomyces tenuis]|uniref:hypothetical protein n=1 Tax=Glycomyces tenuis TaxID=58116 RepID=UPI00041985EF|nr:hypothetical protein [Glycomyces tenuis]
MDASRPFQLAVKAMVTTALPSIQYHYGGVKVTDEELVYPYLVQWPTPATGRIVNLAGNLIPVMNYAKFVAVGLSIDEVMTMLDRVGQALRGKKPVIEGWQAGFLRELPNEQPISENTETMVDGQPTYRGWADYQMSAERARVTGS